MLGQTLGHYRIVEKIGAGGMGEVYRARDEHLGRDVALKVLPAGSLADEADRKRFRKEALTLSKVNHPNIATVHDFDTQDGVDFLVMEHVAGKTLAEKLQGGALPEKEVLRLGGQIAAALQEAHERGVVHRDLKPGNISLTEKGQAKVLDFGLAKLLKPVSQATTVDSLSESRTFAGTLPYMAPEQLRGEPVDVRTDIHALGAVLYEMATDQRAFPERQSTLLSDAILHQPPLAPRALNGRVSTGLEWVILKCLEKDPERRYQSAKEVGVDLRRLADAPLTSAAGAEVSTAAPQPAFLVWQRALPGALVGLIVAVAAISLWNLWPAGEPSPTAPKRFGMVLPTTQPLAGSIHRSTVALSPDGTRLVYVGSWGESTQLYLREFDSFDAKPIPGTEGAEAPSFSPDGEWVVFFADGQLKKVSLRGGASFALCAAPEGRGASWGSDDIIVFTPAPGMGLSRVSAAGGTPQVVTTPENDERGHRWPDILPGSKAVLFTIQMPSRSPDEARIAVQSLETDERRILVEGGTYARYAPTGHLVYARAGTLLVAPFDLARLKVTGPAVPLLEDVRMDPDTGGVDFSFSRDGTLVYAPGSTPETDHTLVWVNRKGEAQPLTETRRVYETPSLSPNGQRMTVTIDEGANEDIWVHDLRRGTQTRLTFAASDDISAIWTPDGKRLTFSSDRAGGIFDLFWKATHTTGVAEQLTTSNTFQYPASWSPDGQVLAFTEIHPTNGPDIWLLPLERERKPRPFLQTPFTEWAAMFSPDGRWLAYSSDESGRFEVYVVPFPGPGAKWQISTEGGTEPVWARNGRELFYRNGDKMTVVSIAMQPTLIAGTPRVLFERHYERGLGFRPNYDVAPDGQRFVMIKASQQEVPRIQLHVLLNWCDEIRRRVRTGKD